MNALLIYPEFPETYWSFKHALKFVGKRAAQPPLGLMTVAALLPKAWKKRLVDTNVERLSDRWGSYTPDGWSGKVVWAIISEVREGRRAS